MELPDTFWTALTYVGGVALICLGLSFFWKFIDAALNGRVKYWAGLEAFGGGMIGFMLSLGLFHFITVFLSPLFCHLPSNPEKSLIKTKQALWVHLFFAPIFFVLSLMCMTSGADMIKLPGSTTLNYVLTLGRTDIPPCIVYSPPDSKYPMGSYSFPFVKKATKVVLRFLVTAIPTDKKNSYNPYEKNGESVEKYSKTGNSWLEDDDDKPTVVPASNSSVAPRTVPPSAPPAVKK